MVFHDVQCIGPERESPSHREPAAALHLCLARTDWHPSFCPGVWHTGEFSSLCYTSVLSNLNETQVCFLNYSRLLAKSKVKLLLCKNHRLTTHHPCTCYGLQMTKEHSMLFQLRKHIFNDLTQVIFVCLFILKRRLWNVQLATNCCGNFMQIPLKISLGWLVPVWPLDICFIFAKASIQNVYL